MKKLLGLLLAAFLTFSPVFGANLEVKDGAGNTKYMKTSGTGTSGDPFIPEHTISGTVTVSGTVTSNLGTLNGAATAAKQPALGTAGTASSDVITVQGISGMTAVKVDGSATTQPISASSLPLPTGASTAAKQPALGTAGTPSSDVITVQGVTSMTALKVDGSAVTQPVSGTVSITANSSVNVNQVAGNTISTGNGTAGTGTPRVTIASDNTAFTVNAAQSGTWTVQPGNTANTTPWLVSPQAATAGGATPGKLISAASTNATSVKASAGTVYLLTASNTNAAARYLKIYNKASAPTVGTDTPVHTFIIPGNTAGAGTNIPIPSVGMALGTGFAFAVTTGATDADTGAVAANEIIVNYEYK